MKRLVSLAICLALSMGSALAAVAVRMEDGAALLLREDGGEIVPRGVYEDIVPLGDGLFAATGDGARYALLNDLGEALSEARYEELRYSLGTLRARREGGWGMLGRDGTELGTFVYDALLPTGEGGCWGIRESDSLLSVVPLDGDGRPRGPALRVQRVGEPGGGLLPVMDEGGRWGYCDASARMAIAPRYEWAGCFAGDCAAAVDAGRYGAIDRGGNWTIAAEWEFLEVSPSGLILAAGGEGARVFAADGGALAEYAGEGVWIAAAGDGYAVGDADSLRVFDREGAQLEALAPDASVTEGLAGQLIVSEGMWGERCVRLSGTERAYQDLRPLGMGEDGPVYASLEARAARYQNDLLNEVQVSVDMDSARYGLVDGAGEVLVPCVYLSVQCLADDRFLVRDERQWRVINSWGKVLWRSNGAMRTVAPNA